MCGFAGYAGEREYDTSVIRKMTDKIRHRGPDSQDAFVEGKVGLGFVRLSIIDLEGGSQPMFNEDKNLVLILTASFTIFRIFGKSWSRQDMYLQRILIPRSCSTVMRSGERKGCSDA